MTRRVLPVLLALTLVAGCAPATSPGETGQPGSSPGVGASSARPGGPVADIILIGGNVITMDDARPRAEAVAIAGDRILAVGSNEEIRAYGGPETQIIELDGRTLTPGFADAHQHRIGDGPARAGIPALDLIDAAIAQGLTTLDELFVNPARIDELRALDGAGDLRLRVNAYLAANENTADGTLFDPYYDEYEPGQAVSPGVRLAGLKVFTDFDNATILLFEQAELNAFVLELHRKGWQLAIKTVSTRSLAMIIEAVAAARASEPGIVDARVRLEHMIFATPEQISRMRDLGMVPAINLNIPGEVVGDASIDALIASEPAGSYVPWRSLFEAGLPVAGISSFPSYYVDEPTGAPFGSPLHLIYQAATGVGNLGVRAPEEFLGQLISPEQAMRSLTVNAAYAAFQDDILGSVTVGKLADLVVLSANPLAVPVEQINEITVAMTMIGGTLAYCAESAAAMCAALATPTPTSGPVPTGPGSANLAATAVATASSSHPDFPAGNAIDGTRANWNATEAAPGWIELALAGPSRIDAVQLVVAQSPAGESRHEVWIQRVGGEAELVHTFSGLTRDGDVLVFAPTTPLDGVTLIRIETTELAGGLAPAWQEIEVLGAG